MKLVQVTFVLLTTLSCNKTEKLEGTSSSKNAHTRTQQKQSAITVTDPLEESNGKIQGVYGGCGYNHTPEQTTITLYKPRLRELSQINSILKFSGLSSNFKIYSANIDNAVATIIDGKRYILYDPKLLSYTDEQSGNYWSSMSILAHEIGHHLSGHTITSKGSNPSDELEADKYSGFVLYKLGANISQATAAMKSLGSETGSISHPAKLDRIKAITKGWNEANQQRYDAAIPPPPEDIVNPDGGIDDFSPRNLLDKDNYERLFQGEHMGIGLVDNLEGIILERSKFYHGTYVVLITKNDTDFTDGNLGKGNKATIDLFDAWEADQMIGRSGLSWLDGIMVPGRKIRFNVAVEGTAPSVFFTRIKSLPAN